MNAALYSLWAKSEPFRCLPAHCVDVGQMALVLLDSPCFSRTAAGLERAFGCSIDSGLGAWLGYLCALHDLGKAHPAFQGKCPERCAELRRLGLEVFPKADCRGYRHEALSADWVLRRLPGMGWEKKGAKLVRVALVGHHGDFGAPSDTATIDAEWNDLQEELDALLRSVFRPPTPWTARISDHRQAALLLSGLLVFSDWLASNVSLFWSSIEAGESMHAYSDRSRQTAQEVLTRIQLDRLPRSQGVPSFQEMWPELTPRSLQVAGSRLLGATACPGLLLIEAPMGEGKTELAVYSALAMQKECNGLYFALPTAATSNQMYARMTDFLTGFAPEHVSGLRLVHGGSWLVESIADELAQVGDDAPDTLNWAAEWFRPKRRALLSPFGVGTVDQVMLAALAVKFGFLRWFGLAARAIVVDEVHAYDSYMLVILERVLRWCGSLRIPVVLLSATLPTSFRKTLLEAYSGQPLSVEAPSDYPLLTLQGLDGSLRFERGIPCARHWRLEVETLTGALGQPDKLAAHALELVHKGGVLCVLCNTVRCAQAVFKKLAAQVDPSDCQLLLFHARFSAERRDEIEKDVLRCFDKRSAPGYRGQDAQMRPHRAILVATQVVEQSLDLDFDIMLSELAPIDLLLQRVGRLHRHDRPRPAHHQAPRLLVALPGADREFGASGRVYSQFILLKTWSLLGRHRRWQCPADLRWMVESVYDDRLEAPGVDPDDLEKAWDQHCQEEQDLKDAANQGALINPPMPSDPYFWPDPDAALREAEEGESANPLVARTRLGDSSRTVFALDEGQRPLVGPKRPSRDDVRALLGCKVSLPDFWLRGVEGLETAPGWLGHGQVLFFNDSRRLLQRPEQPDCWLREDSRLGFVLEEVNS